MRGIWFFGMSGAGKTFSSSYIFKKINMNNKLKPILIDADLTRKYVNFDSGFTMQDRKIVIKRNFGIAYIAIESGCFPIICSVYMNNLIGSQAINAGIKLIKLSRDMREIINNHPTYKNKKNIVGLDIEYPNFDFEIVNLKNTLNQKHFNNLDKFVEEARSN